MPRWYVVAWVLDIALWFANVWTVAVAGLLFLGFAYLYSLRDPWRRRPCGACQGSSRMQRAFGGFGYSLGCRMQSEKVPRLLRCYGGRRLRWGVRVLTPGKARDLTGV
jgi:hypothetical protein